ncbi:hypothetical protein [Persicirhabdus sediminis]|uniref:Uncharacterized protein n=1 Tax=Persicirhabdus sediminis TaxID=454144 RepID=A0A8J7MBE8_9BACT|nr:hypothetical protein [Persicirhabdus sediminis]MBK1790337.1 hypothetical protein [Persicirhabdus sediminis]
MNNPQLPPVLAENLNPQTQFFGSSLDSDEQMVFNILRASGSWLLIKPFSERGDRSEQWIHPLSMNWKWSLFQKQEAQQIDAVAITAA